MILRYLFAEGMSWGDKILMMVFSLCAVLFTLTVHETAHGLMAYWMGDRTAKNAGRLSLNPLRHLDIIGTVALLLFGFGWAKPVPVDPRNFKRIRLGMVLVAVAGPLSNFIIAFLGIQIYVLATVFGGAYGIWGYVGLFFYALAIVSTGLGIFNLIPIPPLDGSKILGEALPLKWRFKYYSLQRYSRIIFLVFIILSDRLDFISRAVSWVTGSFQYISLLLIKLVLTALM